MIAKSTFKMRKSVQRFQDIKRWARTKRVKSIAVLLVALALFVPATLLSAATVEYDLTIAKQEVNITGQPVQAMTLNGQIPGPTLRFTDGDHAVIRVHNMMDVETSIHWHGILLPNNMDGVPHVTYPPIASGQTFTYEFDLRQSGTYWYHSHTLLQEQLGLFGSLVIAPKSKGKFDGLRDHVVVLSDWTDEAPNSVLHTLKRGSEWYSIKKDSGQSVLGAMRVGLLGAYFSRELQRMPPMGLSDVYYDRFLLNGTSQKSITGKPGEKIRLRIIDGSSTTFFYLQFAGGPLQIISADGQMVQPFDQQRLLIAVAETYDVIVTVPDEGSYEFRATAHDGSGKASLWIGEGTRHAAPDIPSPNLYVNMGSLNLKRVLALTPGGSMGMPDYKVHAGKFDQPGMNGMGGMQKMDGMKKMDHDNMASDAAKTNHSQMVSAFAMESEASDKSVMGMEKMTMDKGIVSNGKTTARNSTWLGLLAEDVSSQAPLAADGMSPERPGPSYDKLRALQPTAFDSSKPVREIRLTLDGDMERFVWFLNNKPLSESDSIEIKRDEVVRFIMINRTMMHHPMHLHGHFFRVLNAQGDYSPLKHTVDVAPMTTTVIEFKADEFGDWFFHCHLLYHMMSGMARVVHYQDFELDPATAAVRPLLYEDPFYFYGQADVLSQLTQGEVVYANTRHIFSAEWQAGWQHVDDLEWKVVPTYNYYLNRFTTVFAGADLEGADDDFDKHEAVFGLRYLLPLNIMSRMWVDTAGGFQFALGKHLELTPRLAVFSEVEYDTKEYLEIRAGASYLLSKHFSIIGQWHSDFGWGGGLGWQF
ncbi:MAG: multicopper oxidase domain-containing protein [Kiritimatiellae bacterium]|jgi:CopA family copper-resistance protein|nr:multicopper oxidase domain-containing protein [Kiritimatiellia bacterium]